MLTIQQKRVIETLIDEMDDWGNGKIELCWYRGEFQPITFSKKVSSTESLNSANISQESPVDKKDLQFSGYAV